MVVYGLLLTVLMVSYFIYSAFIDRIYARRYASVFGSFDIDVVDHFMDEVTEIIYFDISTNTYMKDTYKNLRGNVIKAFQDRSYETGSSYGYSPEGFNNGEMTIHVNTGVSSDYYDSDYVKLKIKRKNLVFYYIKSIESDNSFFGYLFFGIQGH